MAKLLRGLKIFFCKHKNVESIKGKFEYPKGNREIIVVYATKKIAKIVVNPGLILKSKPI
jgi:hypothetical protein